MDALIVGCDAGHRFDLNKRGYISLLPPSSKVIGDSQAMLDARSRFFETGNFSPIADAVAAAAVQASQRAPDRSSIPGEFTSPAPSTVRLAEIGCGTGYYLAAAAASVAATGSAVEPLAADLSPFAVRMAVRAVPRAAGVVLDVWQPLPLLGGTLDGILSVFAPRNLSEFARVLAPGGFLVAVVPTTQHLSEVRADGLAIGIPDGKPDALSEAASPWFTETARELVEFEMELTESELANIIGMGPSAHHSPRNSSTTAAAENADSTATPAGAHEARHAVRRVTASVTVLTYRLASTG